MKAIRITRFGGPEVLELQELPTPEPGPGEALVRIATAGVNYRDIYERVGRYGGTPPMTAGAEGAGTVEAIGEGVRDLQPGARVAFTNILGAYAQYVVAPAGRLVPLPDDVSFEIGAAFPLQGMTAHYLVHEYFRIVSGTNVLVHAAAGGVGLLLVQMLRAMDARIIATTSTQEKAEIVRAAGADDVILYTKTNFVDEVKRLTNGVGADLVLDGVGKIDVPRQHGGGAHAWDHRALRLGERSRRSGRPERVPSAFAHRRGRHAAELLGNARRVAASRA